MKKGLLIILSGPSGVGKGTIRKYLMEHYPELNLHYSISMTTRAPRNKEQEGVDYFFVSKEEFEKNIEENNFLEYSSFVGNKYGTPKRYVFDLINQGFNVLLEIEVNGAKQVLSRIRKDDDHVSIFLTATIEELRARIMARKTESEQVINERLSKALIEFDQSSLYDFVVQNDEVERASTEIANIIKNKIHELEEQNK